MDKTRLALWSQLAAAATFCLLLQILEVSGVVGNYYYIDCFTDVSDDPDLDGQLINFGVGDFPFDDCAGNCRKGGFPYFGIQAMRKCNCGKSYGKHGVSSPAQCNYTCDSNIRCGGVMSNDVYYSTPVDTASRSNRELILYTEATGFDAARSTCVKNNGDLFTVMSAADQTNLISELQKNGITSGKVWQGLWKRDGTTYEWTDASKNPYSSATYTSYWKTGDPLTNLCVAIDVAERKWESVTCSTPLPYLCMQNPLADPEPTSANEVDDEDATTDETSSFNASRLSLYIVLPLFGLCYGGSCVLYCAHKIYKSFKRKKRQKMLLARLEDMSESPSPPMTEYEPHNKPQYPTKPVTRPFSAGKRAAVHPMMAPAPMQNGYFGESKAEMDRPPKGRQTPVENIRIPSPRKSQDPEMPNTTRDVQLSMSNKAESSPLVQSPAPPEMTPPPPVVVSATAVATAERALQAMKPEAAETSSPPRSASRGGSQSAMGKAEMRRKKLLETALREARERRRQEQGDTPQPPSSDNSRPQTGSSDQWAQPNNRPKYNDSDSGDSSLNLLNDNDRGRSADPDMSRDPTTMSIQEILRQKVANRKRKKKILSA